MPSDGRAVDDDRVVVGGHLAQRGRQPVFAPDDAQQVQLGPGQPDMGREQIDRRSGVPGPAVFRQLDGLDRFLGGRLVDQHFVGGLDIIRRAESELGREEDGGGVGLRIHIDQQHALWFLATHTPGQPGGDVERTGRLAGAPLLHGHCNSSGHEISPSPVSSVSSLGGLPTGRSSFLKASKSSLVMMYSRPIFCAGNRPAFISCRTRLVDKHSSLAAAVTPKSSMVGNCRTKVPI